MLAIFTDTFRRLILVTDKKGVFMAKEEVVEVGCTPLNVILAETPLAAIRVWKEPVWVGSYSPYPGLKATLAIWRDPLSVAFRKMHAAYAAEDI